jgi:hypothetical protein
MIMVNQAFHEIHKHIIIRMFKGIIFYCFNHMMIQIKKGADTFMEEKKTEVVFF